MERVFDAPRELVWQAWTKPEHLAHWWGPKGWTLPVCQIDFRPGGVWHYCMRGPAGEESWGKAVYREIVEPERIVFLDAFADAAGNSVEGMPEMLIMVIFAEHNGQTKLTSRAQFASAADLESVLAMGMAEGLTETWDRLEAYLAQA
ncbi:MAG: SRPBCC domain-containing protein [Chloroflexota bacterium]